MSFSWAAITRAFSSSELGVPVGGIRSLPGVDIGKGQVAQVLGGKPVELLDGVLAHLQAPGLIPCHPGQPFKGQPLLDGVALCHLRHGIQYLLGLGYLVQ